MNVLVRASFSAMVFSLPLVAILVACHCAGGTIPAANVDHFVFSAENLDEDTETWTYVSADQSVMDKISIYGIGDEYAFQYGLINTNDLPVFSLWVSNSLDKGPGIFAIKKGDLEFFALIKESYRHKTSLVATSWCLTSASGWGFENTCFGPCELFASEHGTAVNIFETLSVKGMNISLACLGDARELVHRKSQGIECHVHNELDSRKMASKPEIESILESEGAPIVYFEHAPLLVILDQLASCSQLESLVFGTPGLVENSEGWAISIPCYCKSRTLPYSPREFPKIDCSDPGLPSVSFSGHESSYISFFEKLASAADGTFSVSNGCISISGK